MNREDLIERLKRWTLRAGGWVLGPQIDRRVRMLGYHSVGDGEHALSVSIDQFRRQIEWLIRHRYLILTLREWWQGLERGESWEGRVAILTFDDGYRGVFDHALPILAKRGIAGTVFVVTRFVGDTNRYDAAHGAQQLPLMGWDQLERLRRLGWDIQSHGQTHAAMTDLQPVHIEDEVGGSRAALRQRMGDPVEFFCFPYGLFNRHAVNAVSRAGYTGAVTCLSGTLPIERSLERYLLRRVMVDGSMSLSDFAFCFREAYVRVVQLREGRYANKRMDALQDLWMRSNA